MVIHAQNMYDMYNTILSFVYYEKGYVQGT